MHHQVEVSGELRRRWCACITDILRFYIAFCKKHRLRYFIAYGSAIGAARHHGMIPWDDDIDVVMPRPDFERFLQLCRHEDLGHFEIVSPFNTPGYPLPFYKLCDKNTTLWESEEYRCVHGMYIDIFIYDGMADDRAEAERCRKRYTKCWNWFAVASSYYSADRIRRDLAAGKVADLALYFLFSLNRGFFRRRLLKRMYAITHKYRYDDCKMIVKYPPGYDEFIPKAWIEETTEIAYEDLMVTVPKDYTRWLNHYFGDYTQLPPEEQRHPHHLIAYVNLERRETLQQVMEKVRKQEQKQKQQQEP